MKYLRDVWNQLKGLTSKEFARALEKDKWEIVDRIGAGLLYRHPDGRMLTVHMHPSDKKGYGPKLLKHMLEQTGWCDEDLKRLKLIK